MFEPQPFDREKHVYRCDEFSELLKDAVRFFHGTPVSLFPPKERFTGAGVYALYYIGKKGLYAKFGQEINREEYRLPIYVGKAEPTGWRQSGSMSISEQLSNLGSLITKSRGLQLCDFRIRAVSASDCPICADVYAHLIKNYRPVWNRFIFRKTTDVTTRRWLLFHPTSRMSRMNRLAREAIKRYLESA